MTSVTKSKSTMARSRTLAWMVLICASLTGWIALPTAATAEDAGECERLEALAAEYREYREQYRRDTDRLLGELRRWDGPMHRVMGELGLLVAACGLTSREVRKLLGQPDRTVRSGKRYVMVEAGPGETHLVYWWRGGHDYLYFVVREGRVVDARWWYAGE